MISVIIPHFNQPDSLVACLDSLAAQTLPSAEFEVIIVDNGSTETPDRVLKTHPGVTLLSEPTPGPGPARNLGVTKARGEILAFIDADCVAAPDWLAELKAALDAGADILGGDVRILHKDPDRPTIWEAYESQYSYRMDIYIRRDNFTGTGNLAMRRAVFDQVGGFKGIGHAEDIDWGHRATKLGLKITYVATAKVFHPARTSFTELRRKWDRHSAHLYQSYRSPLGRLKWLARAGAMVASPLAEVPAILTSPRIMGGLRGRALAFAGLTAVRLYRGQLMLRLLVTDRPEKLANHWRKS